MMDSAWLLGFRVLFPEERPSWWCAAGGLLAVLMPFLYIGSDATGSFFLVTMYAFVSTITATVAKTVKTITDQQSGAAGQLEGKIAEFQGHLSGVEGLSSLVSENAELKDKLNKYDDIMASNSDLQSQVEKFRMRAEQADAAAAAAERERDSSSEDCQRLRTTLSRFRRQQRVLSNAYQEKDQEHKQLQDQLEYTTNSRIHEARDEQPENQEGEALIALRVMTATVDDQTRQINEMTHQIHDKDTQIANLSSQLSSHERELNISNGRLASMEDVVAELATCKAELSDMTDEVFELQTLLEAAKRQALEAEGRATPARGIEQSPGGSYSKKQREEMILARVRGSPAYTQ